MVEYPSATFHPRVDDFPTNPWVEHTVEVTAGPTPNRVSLATGFDSSDVEFTAALDLQAWEVAIVAADTDARGTGTVIASGGAVTAPETVTVAASAVNTAAGEGTHLLKIYGQDLSGNWSP